MSIVQNWREYMAALSATLIAASAGTSVGWSSPTLPILQSENSTISTSPDQGSWITSFMILASALSPAPAAYLADRVGRKRTLLMAAVPCLLGWLLISRAQSVVALYIARLISGLGYGIAYTVAPMYLGEIASNEVRGSMATLITVMSKLGILTQYCIGPYVSMAALAGFNMSIPILFALTFSSMPESPYFYLKNGQIEQAENSLKKLRGKNFVKDELQSMESLVNENMKSSGKWLHLLTKSGNRKSLIILLGIYMTQQFCGSTAVISYAQQIFGEAEGGIGASEASIIFGTVQLCTSTVSSMLVDRLGRKPLLLISSCGVGLSNVVVGTYFFLKYISYQHIGNFQLVPLICIPIFIFSYTIGLATVPFAISSEIFPTNIKSKATCVIQIFVAIMTFAVTKLYQVVSSNLGTYVAFWGFAFWSAGGVLFIVLILPETKGKSFAAIQDKINLKRKNRKNNMIVEFTAERNLEEKKMNSL